MFQSDMVNDRKVMTALCNTSTSQNLSNLATYIVAPAPGGSLMRGLAFPLASMGRAFSVNTAKAAKPRVKHGATVF